VVIHAPQWEEISTRIVPRLDPEKALRQKFYPENASSIKVKSIAGGGPIAL
jgi:hypothetical protein